MSTAAVKLAAYSQYDADANAQPQTSQTPVPSGWDRDDEALKVQRKTEPTIPPLNHPWTSCRALRVGRITGVYNRQTRRCAHLGLCPARGLPPHKRQTIKSSSRNPDVKSQASGKTR